MRRRESITTTAGHSRIILLPEGVSGSMLMAGDFCTEAYNDNKVVRVFDLGVSNYDYSGTTVFWKSINPNILRQMLHKSLTEISGQKSEAKAWKMILAGDRKANLTREKVAMTFQLMKTQTTRR
jgi:hypothetical protein